MKSKKEIGAALQTARKNGGFKSAKAFAEHMGYNVHTYIDWEQGRHLFSFEQAWEMADVLRLTLDELGGREFAPIANANEAELIDCFRNMTPAEQSAYLHMAKVNRNGGAALNNGVSEGESREAG